MAFLAIAYVGIGLLADENVLAAELEPVETAITAIFVVEYAIRIWAAESRLGYFRGHLPDLLALFPVARGLRILRLIRLLRLLRTLPLLYRASGLDIPVIRRLGWHLAQLRSDLDSRVVSLVMAVIVVFIGLGSLLVTALEKTWTFEALAESVYWATNTVLGSGDPGFVGSPAGWVFNWLLIILGLTLLAVATGVLVSFMIDVALKEGRGMGASGYSDHVVVCGWNASARELIDELRSDEYDTRVVLVAELDRNPAGNSVYFVSGDPSDPAALRRAGIEDAAAALIFPPDTDDAADMRSILIVLAVETIAPRVRTIAEVNNHRNVEHFRRAGVNEVLVPSRLSAHLAARSALYPGLSELVTDIVSGGDGSELYRIALPAEYLGLSVDDVSARLRADHRATLLAISRGGETFVNPPADFRLEPDDDALVVAESLGALAPLRVPEQILDEEALAGARTAVKEPAG